MKRIYLVICEGETEEAYVDFLRQSYRLPIRIVSKVSGANITARKVSAYQREMMISGTDLIRTYLLYDLDVPAVSRRLGTIDAVKLLSNPCIELWFMLHSVRVTQALPTRKCLEQLRHCSKIWENYKKSTLSQAQKQLLWANRLLATDRAKLLGTGENPSTTVYSFIEELESQRSAGN